MNNIVTNRYLGLFISFAFWNKNQDQLFIKANMMQQYVLNKLKIIDFKLTK